MDDLKANLSNVSKFYEKRGNIAKYFEELKGKMESDPKAFLEEAGLDKYYQSNVPEFIIGTVLIAAGIALAFMGRRIFKVFLTLSGLIIGSSAALYLIVFIENFTDTLAPSYVFWVTCILGALFGAYLFNTAWKWGIYIMAAFGGYLVGVWTFSFIPPEYQAQIPNKQIFFALFSIIGGIAAKYLDEFVVITSSSLIGAFTIVTGIDLLHPVGFRAHIASFTSLQNLNLKACVIQAMGKENIYYCMLGVLFFTIAGIYVQYRHQPRSFDRY